MVEIAFLKIGEVEHIGMLMGTIKKSKSEYTKNTEN